MTATTDSIGEPHSYQALTADLARTLHLNHGLTQILTEHADQHPAPHTGAHNPVAPLSSEPHRDSQAVLVADLAGTLHLTDGLREITTTEHGHAHLLADLTSAIDTGRGLQDITGKYSEVL